MIPTFAARVALTGQLQHLPQCDLRRKLSVEIVVKSPLAPATLPKGSKLLDIVPALLPSHCCKGGIIVSDPKPDDSELAFVKDKLGADTNEADTVLEPDAADETQIWGVPWTDEQFVQQMVKFGHPSMMDSYLPSALKETIRK